MLSEASAHRFDGFVPGARATAVPSAFFTELLPRIEEPEELRVTLYVIFALGRRKGYPRFVTRRELEGEAPLMAALGDGGDAGSLAQLGRGLAAAAGRGSLLEVDLERGEQREQLYLLNTPSGRRAAALLRSGRLGLGRPLPLQSEPPASERANVFQLYEENIGPLTPLVAEDLKEAEQLYPAAWIAEAVREAAVLNKRSWRYVARILERWAAEGRKGEEAGRHPGAEDSIRSRVIRRFDRLAGG